MSQSTGHDLQSEAGDHADTRIETLQENRQERTAHDAGTAPADDEADQAVGKAQLVLHQRRQQHHRREVQHAEYDDQEDADDVVAVEQQTGIEIGARAVRLWAKKM